MRYGEGLFIGHRFHDAMDLEPAVPFGYGLSYTTFSIGAPQGPTRLAIGEAATVTVEVANTGGRVGSRSSSSTWSRSTRRSSGPCGS
ncbi:MAG: hypothetical protein R2695_17805 [Acidimicrobiales bacterium]